MELGLDTGAMISNLTHLDKGDDVREGEARLSGDNNDSSTTEMNSADLSSLARMGEDRQYAPRSINRLPMDRNLEVRFYFMMTKTCS